MSSIQNCSVTSTPSISGNNSIPTCSLSSSSTLSGDDSSEKSQAIPNSLIKEEWQLILGQDASIDDLENAISRCKNLVINCDECTPERKWLVRHLVELRFRLRELQDVIEDPQSSGPSSKIILGHHFTARQLKNLPKSKQYCDHCSGVIWSVVQASYICSDCSFCVHHKCLQNVLRICAHVIASERNIPIEDICPEIGLAGQRYKCAECRTPLTFNYQVKIYTYACFGKQYKADGQYIEPRLCDYSGLYFCPTCHWNDTTMIPARIIHNWDFSLRTIGRASRQELLLLYEKPVINLEQRNPKLFIFVQKLSLVKKLRENLHYMKKYLSECRLAIEKKLLEVNIGTKRYLIQSPEMYSIADLASVENGVMVDYLNKIYDIFEKHIRKCEICKGKAYLCEICGNDEIIFPFDDGSLSCSKCNSVYHRACFLRKNMNCAKCVRLEERRVQLEKEQLDVENGNDKKNDVVDV